uniref:Uncharacterized protein n=1 Tax=Arundo donax TaxID=35708 RepID=A0A0A9C736_ARUDO
MIVNLSQVRLITLSFKPKDRFPKHVKTWPKLVCHNFRMQPTERRNWH